MLDKYKENILLKCLVGSHCYELNHEKSDEDYRGIFILPKYEYESMDNRKISFIPYLNQINDEKNNEVYYELKRFIELLTQGNPNCIEILFLDDKYYKIKHIILKELFDNKEQFLNKTFANSLLGFIQSQIRKAKGSNKKSFNPIDKKIKTPLDFCYVLQKNNRKIISLPLKDFLSKNKINQLSCGISQIPNTRDNYNLFWDRKQQRLFFNNKNIFNELELFIRKKFNLKKSLGYKGIELDENRSNSLRLSKIPLKEKYVCQFSFQNQAYNDYLKNYNEYWNWVRERNEQRYIDNKLASKGYDTKNLSHCWRLLKMLEYFLDNNILKITAVDKSTIFKIKSGYYEYDYLIDKINVLYEECKIKLNNSNLPINCNILLTNRIEKNIRNLYYEK